MKPLSSLSINIVYKHCNRSVPFTDTSLRVLSGFSELVFCSILVLNPDI